MKFDDSEVATRTGQMDVVHQNALYQIQSNKGFLNADENTQAQGALESIYTKDVSRWSATGHALAASGATQGEIDKWIAWGNTLIQAMASIAKYSDDTVITSFTAWEHYVKEDGFVVPPVLHPDNLAPFGMVILSVLVVIACIQSS